MRFRHILCSCALFGILLSASTSQAALILHEGNTGAGTFASARASWAAAYGGTLITEGFELVPSMTSAPSITFTDFTIARTINSFTVVTGPNAAVSEGSQALKPGVVNGGTVTFTFTSAQSAFGVDINDHDNLDTRYFISVNNTASDTTGEVATALALDPKAFVGFISDTPFTTVTFGRLDASLLQDSGQGWDNVQYGSPIPEPGTVASLSALLVGLFVFTFLRRRRKKVASAMEPS